jgi:hypothetical protein
MARSGRCPWCKRKHTLEISFPSVVEIKGGLCKKCSKKYCESRREIRKAYNAKYFREHREERKIYDAKYRKTRKLQDSQSTARSHRKLKLIVLTYYCGGRAPFCQCEGCPIRFLEGLTIDHIIPNRGEKVTGMRLYRELRDGNYPAGFQVLCVSCNLAKGVKDRCPAYGKDHTKSCSVAERNKILKRKNAQ